MRPLYTPLVLFSVKQSDLSDGLNHANHEMAHRVLETLGYKFSPATGVTKQWGKERSFMVVLPPRSNPEYQARLDRLVGLARKYKQDSIMFIHEDRFSELIWFDDKPNTQLGYIQKVPKELAERIGNYTMLGEDAYYACLTTPSDNSNVVIR